MSDEEIKKCLEYCVAKGQCKKCPLDKELLCFPVLEKNALDLINRQQERIEELEIITGLANNRKYYREFVDEVFRKQKGKELSEPDFDYIYQLYFEQQAENEKFQSLCTSKDVIIKGQEAEIEKWKAEYTRACAKRDARICTQDYFKSEAIKEFAEKVKNYVKTHCNPYGKPIFDYDTSLKILKYLDNLKAEMAGGENA